MSYRKFLHQFGNGSSSRIQIMSNAVDQNKSDQENDTKFGHFDTECSLNKSFNRKMIFYFDLQQKSLFGNISWIRNVTTFGQENNYKILSLFAFHFILTVTKKLFTPLKWDKCDLTVNQCLTANDSYFGLYKVHNYASNVYLIVHFCSLL